MKNNGFGINIIACNTGLPPKKVKYFLGKLKKDQNYEYKNHQKKNKLNPEEEKELFEVMRYPDSKLLSAAKLCVRFLKQIKRPKNYISEETFRNYLKK